MIEMKETRHGRMVYDAADEFVGWAFRDYGEYSWPEWQLLEQVVPGAVVLEAGAHIGAFTVPMARVAKEVYAFEPQRLMFQMLCANVVLNGLRNVHARQAALGASVGECLAPAAMDGNTGGCQLREVKAGEAVPVVTVDSLGLDFGVIRADIEDMEIDLLRGARETIERCQPVMYLESNDDPAEILDELGGYRCYWHFPEMFPEVVRVPGRTHDEAILSFNLLCVPNSRDVCLEGFTEAKAGDHPLRVARARETA